MGFHTVALLLLLLCMDMAMVESSPQEGGFNVVEFGAVGNGKTDDSEAFQKAWKAVCGSTSKENSSLLVPKGKTFLLKTVVFEGPCKSPSINFQVLGNIIAPSKKDFGSGTRFWVAFSNVDGLNVNGDGDVDGNGSSWWSSCENGNGCGTSRPPVLKFDSCNNLQVSGLRITNAPRNHISMANCTDATISNINITTPGTTPNTDGIDVSLSTRIKIQESVIKTGDDCIALNTGCSYINITSVRCGPGHGIRSKPTIVEMICKPVIAKIDDSALQGPSSCFSCIGSLGEGGRKGTVEEVHVVNCAFVGTQNAARIKTWQGGSGFAKKILFKNITLVESMNPILIDQYYCDDMKHCKNQTSAVEISDISFIGFTGTSATGAAVQLLCSESVGCHRLVLDGINITASPNLRGGKDGDGLSSKCINAHGTSSASNMPSVPCLLPNDVDKLLHS